MRKAFIEQLIVLAREDPDIMLITGDLGFGVLDEFEKEFPGQYINAGVAEQNMIALATGLAMEGKKVFTYSIANFPVLRCLEQIRNDACYHEVNLTIVSIGGGFSYGALGMSHHATEDLAILRALPGITVTAPGDEAEVKELTRALACREGVGYLRLDKSFAENTLSLNPRITLGSARQLRDGRDVTLISAGGILEEALKAADQLSNEGISCRALSMHTVKPLDVESVRRAAGETGGIITIEEHGVDGGLGGAVAEVCLENDYRPGFFHRVGLRNGFSSLVGSQSYLRKHYQMDAEFIARTVKSGFAPPSEKIPQRRSALRS